MIFGIDDSNDLVLALGDLKGGTFYNWTTRLVESGGFDYTKHTVKPTPSPIKVVAPAAPAGGVAPPSPPADLHAHTKFVDCDNALEGNLKLTAIWYVVDANGVPTRPYLIESNPSQLRTYTRTAMAQ